MAEESSTDVLMVIEDDIATTQLIERVLVACSVYGVKYRKQYLKTLGAEDFRPGTVPLFVRCGDPSLVAWIRALAGAKHPYLYYIDDNFWRITGNSPLANYYRHPLIRRSLETAISQAAAVLVNSTELAAFVGRFNKRVSVLAAFFDFSLIKGITPEKSQEIRIGFAGSSSRIDDLELVRPVINWTLETFPKAVFEFAGVLPRGVPQGDRVRYFPYTSDYSEFVRFQAARGWDIGLAPLIDSEANRCKTNNKYREYGACKVAGIYSDLPVYRGSVVHTKTGLLVENRIDAWRSALDSLLTNDSWRSEMSTLAYADVQERYCVERVAEAWSNELLAVGKRLDGKGGPSPIRMAEPNIIDKVLGYLATTRMQVSTSYHEGGFRLVVERAGGRVARWLKTAMR